MKRRFLTKLVSLGLLVPLVQLALLACTSSPKDPVKVNALPEIYPDYIGVTIPAGIAPLDFNFADEDIDGMDVVVKGSKGGELHVNGAWADFDIDDWHALTEQNAGGELTFTVCVKKDGQWKQYQDFKIYVSQYRLDEYGVTYRRIAPGYEVGGDIGIYQRDIHSFKESVILAENIVPGQCMNCHVANRANPNTFNMQLRGTSGGTLIYKDGKQSYLTTKTDSTVANTSYSYWHPDGDYCAFSTNSIHQSFFVGTGQRIEVYDTFSNVLVLDTRTNELVLCPLLQTDDWETYPAFSADGKTLFYCTAKPYRVPAEWDKVKYSLCKISFDAKTGTYGTQVDTLLNARELDKSFTYPRPSYDGKWLMYNVTNCGNFPVNHPEADLWLMNLETGETHPLTEANSDDTESYHSWSLNSRWFVFSSRRENGVYSMPYIAFIDENGRAGKPFLLPQRNPRKYYLEEMDSYNCIDFTESKVRFDAHETYRKVFDNQRIQVTIR